MLIKSKSKENEIQTAVYQDSTYGSDPAHVPALKCENLTKRYGSTLAVSSFSLVIQKGEIISLVGPSGCGKTTLLRLIGGFTNPDSGSIEIAGSKAVADHRFTPPEKRNIGMVFQEGALFPHMNVTQNVAYGLHRGNHKNQQVQKVLELVGMTDLANRMPHELSGGQQQRVALARALAPEPELILLDEPFSNLDPSLREQVRRDMVGIIKASNVTAIFVTHDQEEALLIGDRIAIMNGGSLEHIGSAEDIFHRPANKFTANFVGTVDFISGSQLKGQLVSEIGSINYSNDVHKDDILEVMTRPDCIECVPNEAGSCLIASREFRGAFYMYNVELPSGNTIRCLLSHTQEYNIGDRVDVVLRHSHSLLPFKNGVLDLSPGQ